MLVGFPREFWSDFVYNEIAAFILSNGKHVQTLVGYSVPLCVSSF